MNNPIIILGSHRSGSKLLARIIGSSKGTCLITEHIDKKEVPEDRSGVDDSVFWWDHCNFSHEGVPENYPPLVEETQYDEDAMIRVKDCYMRLAGTDRLVLKNPQHLIRLPYLRAMFPDAQYIYIVRNPWHVIQSMNIKYWAPQLRHSLFKRITGKLSPSRLLKKHKRARSGKAKQYPAFVLRTYENYMLPNDLLLKSANSWGTAVSVYLQERSSEWQTVVYEELVENPQQVVGSIFSGLGLSDSEGMARGVGLVKCREHSYDLIKRKFDACRYKEKVQEMLREGCSQFSYPITPH